MFKRNVPVSPEVKEENDIVGDHSDLKNKSGQPQFMETVKPSKPGLISRFTDFWGITKNPQKESELPTLNGGRRRNTKKATRKAKKGGRIAKKGARKANKSRRTRK
jgi:hypothetical protein